MKQRVISPFVPAKAGIQFFGQNTGSPLPWGRTVSEPGYTSTFNAAINASCGISILPNCRVTGS